MSPAAATATVVERCKPINGERVPLDTDKGVRKACRSPSRGQRAIRRGLQRLTIEVDLHDETPQPIPQTPHSPTRALERADMFVDRSLTVVANKYPIISEALAFLVNGLFMGVQCVKWFRFGFVATYFAVRLMIFAAMLLPAFLRVVYWYFFDPRIQRRIRFGPNKRNYIDLYIPPEAHAAIEGKGPKVPVVVAVMGGAWIIGHRAWNAQLGLRLTELGVMVVAVDYRNFPIGGVPEMIEDLSRGMSWAFRNVAKYGGDPKNVSLLGQSAGAHLSALLLLEHALMEAKRASEPENCVNNDDGWSTRDLKGCLLVSGPYDLVALESHLDARGLYSRILHHFCVNGDVLGCSPAHLLESPEWKMLEAKAAARMPPMTLFHGKVDKTVPYWSTLKFADGLKAAGVDVKVDLRDGVAHAEIVVEGPMRGDEYQVEPLAPYLFGDEAEERMKSLKPLEPMFPRPIIDAASWVMPF